MQHTTNQRFWDLGARLRRRDLARRARRRIHSRFYLDCNRDLEKTLLLAGCQRSGSTWLSEIINYRNTHRYIFEPFRSEYVPDCAGFRIRQYIRPGDHESRFFEPAARILAGGLRNRWSDGQNRKLLGNRRLIKEIRGNLFLKWVHEQFPAIPIILLMRHPCAVVRSRLSFKDAWSIDPEREVEDLFEQDQLVADHLKPFRSLAETCRTDFERLVLVWAIEYYVPLRQFNSGEIHVVFYEDLCEQPGRQIRVLFSYLGWGYDSSVLDMTDRPSSLARGSSAIVRGGRLIGSWERDLPAEMRERCVEILAAFGLDRLYDRCPFPSIRREEGFPLSLFQ